MESSDMKNIVVLKDLHSNLIEEAIVVLKHNVSVKIPQTKREQKEGKNKKSDYIIKEAEMHIAEYASNIENRMKINKANKELERKYIRLKRITKFLAILAVLGMIANMIK